MDRTLDFMKPADSDYHLLEELRKRKLIENLQGIQFQYETYKDMKEKIIWKINNIFTEFGKSKKSYENDSIEIWKNIKDYAGELKKELNEKEEQEVKKLIDEVNDFSEKQIMNIKNRG